MHWETALKIVSLLSVRSMLRINFRENLGSNPKISSAITQSFWPLQMWKKILYVCSQEWAWLGRSKAGIQLGSMVCGKMILHILGNERIESKILPSTWSPLKGVSRLITVNASLRSRTAETSSSFPFRHLRRDDCKWQHKILDKTRWSCSSVMELASMSFASAIASPLHDVPCRASDARNRSISTTLSRQSPLLLNHYYAFL